MFLNQKQNIFSILFPFFGIFESNLEIVMLYSILYILNKMNW